MANHPAGRHLRPEVMDRLRRLDVRARIVVEGFISGQHESPYHGLNVEFATHREYVPGDDTRHIDWKVWSRTDRLYIKEYEEETNLRGHLIVDGSRSMMYGDAAGWSKYDHAATAAASLAYLLHRQQDAVGLTLFHRSIATTLPPGANVGHLNAIFATLEDYQPAAETDLDRVFPQLTETLPARGLVTILSDLFVDRAVLARTLAAMRTRGQEVIVMHVLHGDELTFPFEDNTRFKGLEDDTTLLCEPPALRKSYLEAMDAFVAEVKRTVASAGADYVLLRTDEPIEGALAAYLAFRQKTPPTKTQIDFWHVRHAPWGRVRTRSQGARRTSVINKNSRRGYELNG